MEQPAWLYIIIWQQAWLYIICIIYYMSGAGLALYCSATDEKNKQLFASSIKRRHWYTSDQFTYCIPKNYVIVCIVCKSICIFKHCIFSDSFLMVGKNESYLPVTRGSGSSPPTGGISCCSCFTCCTCINLSFLKVIIVVIIVIIISCLTCCTCINLSFHKVACHLPIITNLYHIE